MASLDEMEQVPQGEQQDGGQKAPPPDEQQTELVTRLCIKAIDDGGALDTLEKAVRTSDNLAVVFGQFIVQLIGNVMDQLAGKFDIDPAIFLHPKEGVVIHILDYLEHKLGLPDEFSDQVWPQILEMIKGLAQNPGADALQQQGGGQPPASLDAANPVPGATGAGQVPPSGIEQVGMG